MLSTWQSTRNRGIRRFFRDISKDRTYACARFKISLVEVKIEIIHPFPRPLSSRHGKTLSNLDHILEISLGIHVNFGPDPQLKICARAVEATANKDGSIVWIPTYSTEADRQATGLDGEISSLNDSSCLVSDVLSI